MKRIISAVWSNVTFALRSARFWGAVILYDFMLIYAIRYTFYIGQPVSYTLRSALMVNTETFLLLICAMPSAALFAEDWCSRRFMYSYLRTKKLGYAASTMLSTFIISALVSVIAMSLFIIGLSFINPIIGNVEDMSYFTQTMMTTNGELLVNGHIFLYYALTVLTYSCFMGTMSSFGALLSVWLTNPYIAMVSPIVLIKLFEIPVLLFHLPPLIEPRVAFSLMNHPYHILIDETGQGVHIISTLFPYFYAFVCLTVIIFLAYIFIERKYAANSDAR